MTAIRFAVWGLLLGLLFTTALHESYYLIAGIAVVAAGLVLRYSRREDA